MVSDSYLSFKLSDEFVKNYDNKKVPWGLKDAGGTSFSEIVFLRTYSRKKEDGTKEKWQDVCRRVIEGTFTIQKNWAKTHLLPWSDAKAQKSAQEMFDRMFVFKWTPPGRGIQNMGTHMVNGLGYSTSLQNCAAVSTGSMTRWDPSKPFVFLMSVSMMGVGVGYDTKGAEKDFKINNPIPGSWTFQVPDTREGWAESVKHLMESYLIPGRKYVEFDYSLIRPKGALIKSFGTQAPGPEPLRKLHTTLSRIYNERIGHTFGTVEICDTANLIGKCVVSGNTRRSALLAYGSLEDKDFINLKNWEQYPERNGADGWAWMSNNSVKANVNSDLSHIADGISLNGEPGVIWEDVVKTRGRLIDAPDDKDSKFVSFNPCAEQPLENFECCTLCDVYVDKHESLEDFKRTLKFAFMYGKTVTLLPTHFPETNAVMQKNRRIGTSLSGCANFVDARTNGLQELRQWFDEGYKTVRNYDKLYSEWLCVRESNRVTTIKPGGTTGVTAATSPGIHWTDGGEYFMRTLRMGDTDPLLPYLKESGHLIEKDQMDPDNSVVVYFPIHSTARRSARDVSLFEKAALAVEAQRLWSDNGVSVTLTFDAEKEKEHVSTILNMYSGQLKAVSFLPIGNMVYPQQPYTSMDADEYEAETFKLFPARLEDIYAGLGLNIEDEKFCSTDACLVKEEMADIADFRKGE